MSESKPSVWMRNGLIVWGAIAAATTPLTSAFQWLSSKEGVLGGTFGAPGKLTVLINLCILCAVITLIGLLIGFFVIPIVASQGKEHTFGSRIGAIVLLLFAWSFYIHRADFFQLLHAKGLPDPPEWPFVIVAIVIIVGGISSLLPSSLCKFVEDNPLWSVVLGTGMALALVLVQTLRKPVSYLWGVAGSDHPSSLAAIPVVGITTSGWLLFLFGMIIYVLLYVLFMEWRKRGKFLSSLFSQMDTDVPAFWTNFLSEAGWLQPAARQDP